MTRIVISQPMFFPWRGLFEQIRLADIYIHLMDVPLPQGRSFMNRVQIKTPTGNPWLSAPLNRSTGPTIESVEFSNDTNWRQEHLRTLKQWYAKAPFAQDMLDMAESLYNQPTQNLATFNCRAIEQIASYYDFHPVFMDSRDLAVSSKGSDKILKLVQAVNGTDYITGHGAKNYLEHPVFEAHGIEVHYMDYQCLPYPQLHGPFIPYVSILDLIANTGRKGRDTIVSGVLPWRQVVSTDSSGVEPG
jgi:hypothetical protein